MLSRWALLSVLLLAACAPSPIDVQATVQAAIQMTQTARPTRTPTPTATRTPRPTPTMQPTPAPIGAVVPDGALEIILLSALERETMHIGDVEGRHYIYYYARKGARIIDLAVLVHNTDPNEPVAVKWGDIYVVEPNGDSVSPTWGKVQAVDEANLVDPYMIGISSEDIDSEATLEFVDDTYLRLVFLVSDDPDQALRFHIEDSPRIQFQTKLGN
jgi:hypothetical protein